MRYDNQSCPVCEHVFNENDDVVVCPECGTPHHRECWHNAGGCKNEPLHAQGFEWSLPVAPQAEEKKSGKPDIVCPNCGTHNPAGAPECENCGMKFVVFGLNFMDKQNELEMNSNSYESNADHGHAAESNSTDTEPRVKETVDGVAADDIREFVRVNHADYLKKFKRIANKRISFNWSAFFFSFYWFFYRKMIKQGIVVLIAQFLVDFVSTIPLGGFFERANEIYAAMEATGGMTEEIMNEIMALTQEHMPAILLYNALLFVSNIAVGFLADFIYKKHVFKSIGNIESNTADRQSFHVEMFRSGGVSLMLPAIALLIFPMITYAAQFIMEYVAALF